jgi:hypothetical protein
LDENIKKNENGKENKVYRVLVRKAEERSLGTPELRWEDKTKMCLNETGWEDVPRRMDSSGSRQRNVMGSCESDGET